MASPRVLALAAVAGALFVACGGATDPGLFSANGAQGPLDASTSGPDAQGSSGSGGVFDSGSGSGSGGLHDAGHGDHDSGKPPPPPDSGSGDPGIACGNATCDPASAVCCRVDTSGGSGTSFTFSCTPAQACNQVAAMPIPCDDAHDCEAQGQPAGSICCVTEDPQTGRATTVACSDPSSCTNQTQTWLCDPNVATPCPSGETCSASSHTIPGYDICHP